MEAENQPKVVSFPYANLLNVYGCEASKDSGVARLAASDKHHQPMGIVNGGVYCSLIEIAATLGASAYAKSIDKSAVVVNQQSDFIKMHSKGVLVATATPVERGRDLQLWEVTVTRDRDSAVIATGTVLFQNVPPDPPAPESDASAQVRPTLMG